MAQSNHSQQIVQKLWSYCNVLRDDGLSYGDYVEQLTYLLFLKMADERAKARPDLPRRRPSPLRLGARVSPSTGAVAGR